MRLIYFAILTCVSCTFARIFSALLFALFKLSLMKRSSASLHVSKPAIYMRALQWRRYTRARQVIWPGWQIHRPGFRPGNCFASVIVWTEHILNISSLYSFNFYLFYFDSETISATLAALVFWERQLKRSSTFLRKKCIRVIWLENFVTSKWPGSFTAMAPPLVTLYQVNLLALFSSLPPLDWPPAGPLLLVRTL